MRGMDSGEVEKEVSSIPENVGNNKLTLGGNARIFVFEQM